MSANVHAVLVGLLSVAHTPAQADRAAREVLSQHAHALTEQIRSDPRFPHLLLPEEAADLIDPDTPPADPTGATP